MPSPEIHQPETFFTPKSFAVAQAAGVMAVEYNLDVIGGMRDFITAETGRQMPATGNLDFTVYWNGGRRPSQWDVHYPDTTPDFLYYASGQLSQLQREHVVPTTKAVIAARNTHIIELQTATLDRPTLDQPLARALITPPHQDAKFDASPRAWGSQTGRALSFKGLRDATDLFVKTGKYAGNPEIEAEAAHRFRGAITLRSL